MSFANPLMLLMLVPLAFAAWRLLRRGRRSGIRFSAVGRLPAKAAGWRAKVAALTPFLLLAGLALLTLAAARPRTSLAREKKSVDAIAIAMTVDVSGSMMATDLVPDGSLTRLAAVKGVFSRFVEKRPDDLIGLVTFGGFAATRCPLTADHSMLLHVLKGVEVPEVPMFGQDSSMAREERMTAVGDGLAVALARLKDAKPKTKIAILLSDGISNAGAVTPDEATDIAAKMGVKVYVIGIGVIPEYVQDMFGRRIRTSTLSKEDIVSHFGFDEEQLRAIAKKTGGVYYPVSDGTTLDRALEEIDQLETTKLDADVFNRWAEHFVPFLLAGALLVLLAVTLSMAASRRVA